MGIRCSSQSSSPVTSLQGRASQLPWALLPLPLAQAAVPNPAWAEAEDFPGAFPALLRRSRASFLFPLLSLFFSPPGSYQVRSWEEDAQKLLRNLPSFGRERRRICGYQVILTLKNKQTVLPLWYRRKEKRKSQHHFYSGLKGTVTKPL